MKAGVEVLPLQSSTAALGIYRTKVLEGFTQNIVHLEMLEDTVSYPKIRSEYPERSGLH